MLRRLLLLLMVSILLLGYAPQVPVAAAPPPDRIDIKCATVAPEGSSWMNILEKANKELHRKTRGRVRFKFYASGIAGEEETVLEKMRRDQLQAAGFTGTGLGELVPSVRILELPFAYRSYEEFDYVLEHLAPDFERLFEEQGYTILAWAEGGFSNVFSRIPIRSVEDINRAKCWVRTGDPLYEICIREMANQAIPLDLNDVLTSIQTGLIDTVYVSPLAVIALQWFPHLKYRLELPLLNMNAALIIKTEVLERMRQKDRETLKQVMAKHMRQLVLQTRRDNREAVQVLKEKGIETIALGPEQDPEVEQLRQRMAELLVGKLFDQALLDHVETLLAEARANDGSSGDEGSNENE